MSMVGEVGKWGSGEARKLEAIILVPTVEVEVVLLMAEALVALPLCSSFSLVPPFTGSNFQLTTVGVAVKLPRQVKAKDLGSSSSMTWQ